MKKLILAAVLILICTISVYAATYKVNSKGVLKGPSGETQKIQQKSTVTTTSSVQQIFNTVSSQTYTTNVQSYVGQPDVVEIVIDYSGSMNDWVQEARRVMSSVLSQLPVSIKTGIRVTGYGDIQKTSMAKSGSSTYKVSKTSLKKTYTNSCQATKQVIQIGDKSSNASDVLDTVTLGGATPLVYAMSQVISKDFSPYSTATKKKIILITDGGENCGGNPCAFAQAIGAARKDIIIDVVLVNQLFNSTFSCVASATGGQLYTPNQVYNLSNILINSSTSGSTSTPVNNSVTPVQTTTQPAQNYEFIED